jgi:hypothetical protein
LPGLYSDWFPLIIDNDFLDFVTLTDLVQDLQTIGDFSKTGVVSVQVLGIGPVMANEKLRASCVSTRVSHGQNTPVVVLVFSFQFAVYRITRSSRSVAYWAAALNHKVWDDPMESQSIIKSFFGKLDKVGHSVWRIFFIKVHGHDAFFGVYFSCFHVFIFIGFQWSHGTFDD